MSILGTKTWQTTGTISALNGMVELDCDGSASAVISVSGTFIGSLTFTGSESTVAESGIQGGRLAFKSGVGSLGENVVKFTATTGNTEYRIVTGGKSVRVKATSYTSGTSTIKILATQNASTVFINGPVHNTFEEAIRGGRAFSAGTGVQSLSGSNYLKYRFSNPSDSGVNCFVTLRKTVTATTTTFLTSQLVISPSAITSPTTVTPSNLKTGGVASVVSFTHKNEATALTGGTLVGGLPIPLNAISLDIDVIRLVQPGEVFGYQIQAGGGGLGSAIQTGMSVIWFEETIN